MLIFRTDCALLLSLHGLSYSGHFGLPFGRPDLRSAFLLIASEPSAADTGHLEHTKLYKVLYGNAGIQS